MSILNPTQNQCTPKAMTLREPLLLLLQQPVMLTRLQLSNHIIHICYHLTQSSAAHKRSSANVGSAHCQDDQVLSTLPPDQEPTCVNPTSTLIQPYPNLLPLPNAHPGDPGVNSHPQHLLNQYSAHAFPEALQQDQCHQVHPYQEMQVMYNQFSHPMPMLIYYSGPQHQTTYGAPIPHSILVNSSPPCSPTL